MLYTVLKINNSTTQSIDWHVGEKLPLFGYDNILSVQANGDELNYIFNNFSNIPYSNKSVQVWHGEFARFIAENL